MGAGGGKSHLGAIWCARTGAGTISASQLDDVDVPKLISGGVLLVEDLEGLSAKGERSLFHLLNITQQQRHSMLLTASSPPSRLDIGLADLASRLNALYSVTIGLPDDALLRALILKHLKDRQIALPKDKDGEVGDQILEYMVRRMERSAAGAARLVEALDAEALAQRRPITRALAAKVLDAFDAQDPDDGSAGTA